MAFKEDLGEALVKAVGFYNSGDTPDEAIVKSAQEMNFNLDQTDRLVEKFNTARTINYFEKNPEDRTQNFKIASKEKVAELMRNGPSSEKKASSVSDGYHDYTCYDSKEADYFAPPAEKTAEDEPEENPAEGYSYSSLIHMVTKRAELMKQHAKKLSDSASMVRDVVMTELSKIASSVCSGYDPDERLALFKVACNGNPLLDTVVELSPKWVQKKASEHEKKLLRMNVVDLGDMQEFAHELEYLDGSVKKAEELEKKATYTLEKRKEMLDRLEKVALTNGSPFNGRNSRQRNGGGGGGNHGGGGSNGRSQRYNDAADFLRLGSGSTLGGKSDDDDGSSAGYAIHSSINSIVPTGLSDYMADGFLGSKEEIAKALFPKQKPDTSIKEHIDNLRRSLVLQDLYDNDPILSEADPNELTKAYSSIVQTAPEVSMNKEVVRAILRQSVNAMAVSPFDAKQWADLENVIGKNKSMNKSKKDKDKDE